MTRHSESHPEPQPLVDRAVRAIAEDTPDAETVRRAADRVWQKLAAEAAGRVTTAGSTAGTSADPVDTIDGCADYQALIPAYMAGRLSESRRLLLEDHSRECVSCRRALLAARKGGAPAASTTVATAAPTPHRGAAAGRHWLSLAAAAVLIVTVAGLGFLVWDGWLGGGPVATVAAVEGMLMEVGEGELAVPMAPLAGGAEISAGAPVRTAKDSSAVVELTDGSRVELAERTQIRVRERRRGTTIYVDRGSIIVEAAQQLGPRHLWVSTDEAMVEVTGTIFAVQHGVKGSRVSVVEGEVRVRQGRDETVLHPGMQVTSRASLGAVPIADEIAWSRNFDTYLSLLSELTSLRQEIAQRVAPAEMRFASDLAPRVPADTAVYVALPNVAGSLAESYQVFQDRLASSPLLASWWEQLEADDQANMDLAIERLRDFGSYLGPEVVVVLAPAEAGGAADGPGAPLILAAVDRPDSFRAFVEQELDRLRAEHGADAVPDIVLVEDLRDLPLAGDQLLVWLGDGLLIASNQPERLRAAATGDGGFLASELGEAVADAYADGTQWLLAVDLGPIVAAGVEEEPELAIVGFDDLQRLVVERWDDGDRAQMSAELSFASERRGVASWLAAPAPMGALDFISSEAHMAAAFVVKEPAAMLDEFAAMMGDDAEGFGEVERELGLSVRDDIAAPLGGEVAFALDGPFLPVPSWKLILEVYDPGTLQHALETAVAEANTRLAAEGQPTLTLGSESAGGRTYHYINEERFGQSVYWLYVDGYMVAAPSRALLERTLTQRAAGSTLTAAERFRNLLPRDGEVDFSALFFQNLGPLLSPLAGNMPQVEGSGLTAEQQAALAAVVSEAEPTLAYAYGHQRSITVAGTGPGGPLGLGVQALTGAGGLATLSHALSAAAAEMPAPEAQ